MNTEALQRLLDELAQTITLTDESDPSSVQGLVAKLAAIERAVPPGDATAQGTIGAWIERLKAFEANRNAATGIKAVIDELTREVSRVQRLLDHAEAEPDAATLTSSRDADALDQARASKRNRLGEIELPEAIDGEIFAEFVATQKHAMEELEQSVLRLERDGEPLSDAFWRLVHTIKGEAGIVGISDLQRVCHAIEDLRERDLTASRMAELLLRAKDWMSDALQAYARFALPEQPARAILDLLQCKEVGASGPEDEGLPTATVDTKDGTVGADVPGPTGLATPHSAPHVKELVKVDLERIDELVETIGELVIAESTLTHARAITELPDPHFREQVGQIGRITRELQDIAMRMRMVPLRGVFHKLSRFARDVAHSCGKSVRVEMVGEGTEMDRRLVEQVSDPLLHLVRNAIDHGIEPAELRKAAGKPTEGLLRLSAQQEGSNIAVEVADDGRGLNRAAIVATAEQQGLLNASEQLADDEVWQLIFTPGVSTATTVTQLSGRGVGMDVVRAHIESIRGRIQVHSVPGAGTTFKLILPLTLAIIDGMVVRCGRERYIIPTLSIIESLQPDAAMFSSYAGKHRLINVRGDVLPLVRLDQVLDVRGAQQDGIVVIVEGSRIKLALQVDEVVTHQQVVIKSLGRGRDANPIFAGAAILSDGKVGLILNVDELPSMISSELGAEA